MAAIPAKTKFNVPIKKRTLIARINRKLSKDNKRLRRVRVPKAGNRAYIGSNLERYYIVDLHRSGLSHLRLDLETYGRECGALADWEHLGDD